MQRLSIVVAVALAAAIPLAANAASGASKGSGGTKITVSEDLRHASTLAFIKPGHQSSNPRILYPGEYIVEKAPLRNRAGKRVGTVEGVLTFITRSKHGMSDLFNHRIWILRNGSLFLEGLDSPYLGSHDIVTGGTGAYGGARGVVTSQGKFDIAHLLP